LGISDIYVQVWRGGLRWYKSSRGRLHPLIQAEAGFDPLLTLLDAAASAGISVHAWLNMFYVGKRGEESPLREVLTEEALLTDSFGHRLDEYTDFGSPPDAAG